ncbi:MAG: DUF4214 domain-containing protein, partial [Candidatus Competibacteraceae bacterium]|nr:DUF4214 domain-containing protein [Candidatus Competibacteraceae bacterium]
DLGGLIFWTDVFIAGEGDFAQFQGNLDAIGDFFVASEEFQAKYPATLTDEQFVTALYDNMLNREPDLAGFDFWVNELSSGQSRGAVLVDFANTEENQGAIPNQSAALDSFILRIANDDSMPNPVITPEEAAAWLAANPTLDASVIDLPLDTTAPVVDPDQTATYSEGTTADATLLTVAAADNEGGSGIDSFAIVSGNDKGYFEIDAAGNISLTEAGAAAGADSNDSQVGDNTFTLGIEATDRAGNTSDAVDVMLTVADVTPPEFDTANRSPTSIILTFNEAMDQGSVPVASSFTVLKNGNTGVTINTVTVSNNAVTLSLAAPLANTDTVSVSYVAPPSSPLQDLAGNPAANFSVPNVQQDNTPPSIANQTFSYQENATNPVVATVAVTDSDVASFAIVTGNGNNFFSIDNAGKISLTAAGLAATSASNDFETQPNTFALGVTATDNSGNTSTAATITLNVTDDPSDNLAAPIISSLTTGADPQPGVVLGSNNDDITSGLVSANPNETTFSSIDFINLGDHGTNGDTLNIELRGANYSGGATIQNVENLKLTAATAAATFNATGMASITKVINNASPFALTVNNLSKNALNFEIGNIASGNGAGIYNYAPGELNGTQIAKVTITSNVGAGVAYENITFANVSPVANSLGEIDIDAKDGSAFLNLRTDAVQTSIKTIKVMGTNAVGLNVADAAGNLETTATTINASGNSGGVFVTGLGAAAHTVTGGSGNDLFAFGANLGSTDTITGGDQTSGIGDTLSANGAQLAAVTAAVKPTVTGIETLMIANDLRGVATTVDAALFGGSVSNVRIANQVTNAGAAANAAVVAADAAAAAADAADAAVADPTAHAAATAALSAAVLAAGGSAAAAAAAAAAYVQGDATAQAAGTGTAAAAAAADDAADAVVFNGLTALAAGSSNNFRFDGELGTATGSYTFNILNAQDAGTNNSATLDMRGGAVTAVSTVVLNGVENITVDTTNATGAKAFNITDAALQVLKVQGGQAVNLSGAALGAGVTTVDGTGLTGTAGLTVTLSAAATVGALVNTAGGADIIIGSSLNDTINTFGGGDTITGLGGADKMNGGAGNDTFWYTATGQTGVASFGTGSTSTATLDVLTVNAGDTVNLTGSLVTDANYDFFGTLQVAGNLSNVTTATTVERVLGVYDATAGTFTVGVTNANAVLLNWSNGDDATVDESIVLVGVTDVTSIANGVVTV